MKEKFILELKEEKVISLNELHYNDEYRQKNLEYKDKPSIVSDTMFQTEKRIKYSAYLVSELTGIEFEELLKNMKLTTNELPKKKRKTKGERSDFVAKINGAYINIEVNNNKDATTYERNLGYLFKLYDQNTSGESEYNMVMQINFNNYAYKENKKIIDVYYLRNKEGIVLTKKVLIVDVILPNLLEKCYTLDIESLNDIEKFIYSLIEIDIKKLDKIIKEVPIVKEYVNEAKEVIEEPFFGEAYDHEKANNEQWYKDGYEEGEQKGKLEKTIEMIKSLYVNKVSIEAIAKSSHLSVEEVKKIIFEQ